MVVLHDFLFLSWFGWHIVYAMAFLLCFVASLTNEYYILCTYLKNFFLVGVLCDRCMQYSVKSFVMNSTVFLGVMINWLFYRFL